MCQEDEDIENQITYDTSVVEEVENEDTTYLICEYQ